MRSNYPRPSGRPAGLEFSRTKVGPLAMGGVLFFFVEVYTSAGIFLGGTFLEKGAASIWPPLLSAAILGLATRRSWRWWGAPLLAIGTWSLIVVYYLLIASSEGRSLREAALTRTFGILAIELVLIIAGGIFVEILYRSRGKRAETRTRTNP